MVFLLAIECVTASGDNKASNPSPADGASHGDTWANLTWSAGDTAVSHDVYFGDNFADVDAGTGDTFQGNQTETFFVVGIPGFPYPYGLVAGTTYYWRIDEFDAVTTHKGDVWRFTTMPVRGDADWVDVWVERAKLLALDGAARDRFGNSVSISGDFVIVGADGDDENGNYSGSAYVFEHMVCPTADLTADCHVDFEDFAIFARQWLQGPE